MGKSVSTVWWEGGGGGQLFDIHQGSLINHLITDLLNVGGVHGKELDDSLWQTSLLKELVGEIIGVNGHGGWLPEHHVSKKGGCAGQVAANGSKVER